ncbi:MerR family transcriptional regulator [Streptomyces anulatus]
MTEITTRLSIGQVSERTGLSVHTLRFYESEGLFLTPVRREAGGRRVYGEDDVDWLTVCIILRASGMPLPVLRGYAGLVREGGGNEAERLALMREHEAHVGAQIDRLTESLDLIRYKVAVYEDFVEQGSATARPCHAPPSPA